jgi:small subunit ribosomal protein S13
MPRIEGVDIPEHKHANIALTEIFGIGRTLAKEILDEAGIAYDKKPANWTEEEVAAVRDIIGSDQYIVEGDLRSRTRRDIKRLKDIGSYRGLRHRRGLPVRGQRTRTNARTRKGKATPIAGKKKVASKT